MSDTEIDWNHGNIDTTDLLNFLDITECVSLVLCGAFGDGIYHPDIPLIIKSAIRALDKSSGRLTIDTNGSYVKPEKWRDISLAMSTVTSNNVKKQIVFSIDGTPSNFHTYRVNGDWDSLSTGISIMSELPHRDYIIVWKYIVFKYNSTFDDIKTAYDTAIILGIDSMNLVHTQRGPKEMLIGIPDFEENLLFLEEYKHSLDLQTVGGGRLPNLEIAIQINRGEKLKHDQIISSERGSSEVKGKSVVQRNPLNIKNTNTKVITFSEKTGGVAKEIFKTANTIPQCMNDSNWLNFISSDGTFWPCCFVRTKDTDTIKELNLSAADLESMNIKNHTLEEIVSGPGYDKIINGFDKVATCRYHCRKPDKSKIGLSTV
jgi:hypothetical protein